MQIIQKQYDCIKHVLPVQRGNVRIDNFTFLRAIFYIAENGCKWRKSLYATADGMPDPKPDKKHLSN
jgi:transposase